MCVCVCNIRNVAQLRENFLKESNVTTISTTILFIATDQGEGLFPQPTNRYVTDAA